MLNIKKQSDYGLLLISKLKDKKDYVSLSDILKEIKLPKRFIARIAGQLVKANILESREGKVGGYRLTKKAKNVNLFDYLKIFEGDLAFTKCMIDGYKCPNKKECIHKTFLSHILNNIITYELKKHNLFKII